MSLNWKEIDVLIGDLDIENAYIQQITQYEYQSIVLHLYTQKKNLSLLLSTRRDFVRMCNTTEKSKKEFSNQRFTQLLKSKIRNGKITEIAHIHKQRIIRFTIQKTEGVYYLYFRMWNNGSNLLLTDEKHTILDSLYRRPRSNEVSGKVYDPETDYADSGKIHECVVRDIPAEMTFLEYVSTELANEEHGTLINDRKKRLLIKFEEEITRIERNIETKKMQIADESAAVRLSHYGDLILANIHLIQEHADSLSVTDYENDGATIIIELDKRISPSENAAKYYERAKKEKQKTKYILEEISHLSDSVIQLNDDKEHIPEITTLSELNSYEHRLSPDEVQQGGQYTENGLHFISHGFDILVGRDSKENDILLRKKVRGNDWWLHTRDTPGGYVFIKDRKGKTIPLDVLLDAGNLAVFYSKSRGNPVTNLYYTQVKYLRRAKGAKQGTVIPFQEKNFEVKTDEFRLQKLLGKA